MAGAAWAKLKPQGPAPGDGMSRWAEGPLGVRVSNPTFLGWKLHSGNINQAAQLSKETEEEQKYQESK